MVKKQASAPMTVPMDASAFADADDTKIYWLGSGGIFINCHGTCIMVDPVLEYEKGSTTRSEAGFPLLVPPPITGAQVPRLDAVLFTHADYDHMAPATTEALLHTGTKLWGTAFTCLRLQEDFGIAPERTAAIPFGEEIRIGNISLHLTKCSHNWHAGRPEFSWEYGEWDCCGFYMTLPEGTVWIPGDSILLDEHFTLPHPKLMFFDISADPFHFGTENSLKLVNHYAESQLILYHYGTYDAPEKPAFSADPAWAEGRLANPGRLHVLAPGEAYKL